jgi:LPXTG-motif cell wall-anchored protein
MEGGAGEGGEMEGGAGEGGEMEGGAGEGGEMEGGAGEAPEYLPVTGGEQNATYMVVLAVLVLLFTGAYATRRFQHD